MAYGVTGCCGFFFPVLACDRRAPGQRAYSSCCAGISAYGGAPHATHPYSPQVLTIPARRPVAVRLTDNLGGCGLVTVFPKLGPHGRSARVDVPIGATRLVELYAPRPGSYPYHCAGDMYFGVIKAG